MKATLDGVVTLTHLGVIRAEGPDAATFLHGQLTHDFALLGLSEARLAAFCTAKGRVLASFVGFKRDAQEILLVCSKDLLAPTLKRLSMFVLRAKVKLTDASDDWTVAGLAGSAVARPMAPWSKSDAGDAAVVHLHPVDGVARALWIAPSVTPLPTGATMSAGDWMLGEVLSGIATVGAPVTEAFVPQMLNYESVGGVNFQKGCYPGQEVVARSQFRGVLKRRAMLAASDAAMAAGQEIFSADDPSQPCGTVVQAASDTDGGSQAIVSGQVSALTSGRLHLGTADGPAVSVRPMPYPLRDDI